MNTETKRLFDALLEEPSLLLMLDCEIDARTIHIRGPSAETTGRIVFELLEDLAEWGEKDIDLNSFFKRSGGLIALQNVDVEALGNALLTIRGKDGLCSFKQRRA